MTELLSSCTTVESGAVRADQTTVFTITHVISSETQHSALPTMIVQMFIKQCQLHLQSTSIRLVHYIVAYNVNNIMTGRSFRL